MPVDCGLAPPTAVPSNASPTVTVEALVAAQGDHLRLEVLAGRAGLGRTIASSRIQKPGLTLAGYAEHVHPDRVQVFGNTEMSFLATLPPARQAEVLQAFFAKGLCGLAVTKALPVPKVLFEAAQQSGTPLLSTSLLSSAFIRQLESYLEVALVAASSLHGVLIDVFGVGLLILGKSGIGKSECAVDLLMRGHRLVADDIVEVKRRGADNVIGSASPIIKHHMEIRGLGILNIKDLFGVSAVRDTKKIELAVELVEWDPHQEYDRLGVEDRKFQVLDVEVPLIMLPVRPGRNMASIIEVAARNHLLKLQGLFSARDFQDALNRRIATSGTAPAVADEVE